MKNMEKTIYSSLKIAIRVNKTIIKDNFQYETYNRK